MVPLDVIREQLERKAVVVRVEHERQCGTVGNLQSGHDGLRNAVGMLEVDRQQRIAVDTARLVGHMLVYMVRIVVERGQIGE